MWSSSIGQTVFVRSSGLRQCVRMVRLYIYSSTTHTGRGVSGGVASSGEQRVCLCLSISDLDQHTRDWGNECAQRGLPPGHGTPAERGSSYCVHKETTGGEWRRERRRGRKAGDDVRRSEE